MKRIWRSAGLKIGVFFVVFVCGAATGALAVEPEGKGKESAGVVDQIGTSVKSLAEKIEKEVTGAVKKLEDSETPKKVGTELKRSANSLGEKAGQAGQKLKESFKSN
ncbi:MAG: hypothetical protein RI101_04200 [Nitrospira sp.]|jgi:hypothetical protein|nr:hypothetical protein [Nitrospira sp.]